MCVKTSPDSDYRQCQPAGSPTRAPVPSTPRPTPNPTLPTPPTPRPTPRPTAPSPPTQQRQGGGGGGSGDPCCTHDWKTCANWCGSSESDCKACSNEVFWLYDGLPDVNTCLPRWEMGCTQNSDCCYGMVCTEWKQCQYYGRPTPNPTLPTPPTPRPTPRPTAPSPPTQQRQGGGGGGSGDPCCTHDWKTCANWCGSSESDCKACSNEVFWLYDGLPDVNTCLPRWEMGCTQNSDCCYGMVCTEWKQCQYYG